MILSLLDTLSGSADEILLAVGTHLATFQAFFEGLEGGPEVTLIEETTPLGTGGALKQLEDRLTGAFLVLNGDVVSSLPLATLVAAHGDHDGLGTLALWAVEHPEAFGIVDLTEGGRIQRFLEKPSPEAIFSHLVNAGIYVLESKLLRHIPAGQPVSLEREVFPQVLDEGLFGMAFEGYWTDAGTREGYLEATRTLLEERGGYRGSGSQVAPGVALVAPCAIGASSRVEGGQLGPYTRLGAGCVLTGGRVVHSVLLDRVHVRPGAVVEDSLLGDDVVVGRGARLERCLVADGVHLPAGATHVAERVSA